MLVQIETRTNGAVAITRGPLNFAVEFSFNQTTTIDEVFDQIVYTI